MRIKAIICALLFGACSAMAAGQSDAEVRELPAIEVPYTKQPPPLDASVNDLAWSKGAEIPALTPSVGIDPNMPLQKTNLRLLWDKQFLYVRFVCEDANILATLKGRDAEYSREDVVEVFLDPVGDEKEYIELQLSPNNGVRDVLYLCTGVPKSGANRTQPAELVARNMWIFAEWNLDGLKTAAKRFDNGGRRGWVGELAIPASCLRRFGLTEFNPMKLRANFIRLDHPLDEDNPGKRLFVSSNWSPIVSGRPHRSPAANGYLKLISP